MTVKKIKFLNFLSTFDVDKMWRRLDVKRLSPVNNLKLITAFKDVWQL